MSNPYSELDDFCFWSRAMSWPAPGQIDPVVGKAEILPGQKVATMGSCFAQHLSAHIRSSGLHYFVTEPAPAEMDETTARARNYGVFSARYGNVYTVRQAVQLLDRALGAFAPAEDVWTQGDRYVDAFRPRIEPDGFASAEDTRETAREHLACVRKCFTECDWLVFTLGLTEAWRSRRDGAIYPLAPVVSGGCFDPSLHEFVNFTAEEVQSDLIALIGKLRKINAGIRILLTVSPVPLAATYERRHVLVSTTYSKAALRVAADAAERQLDGVIYFPAYEIITSPAAGGRYYADDLRQVTQVGVKHVMKLFGRHFFPRAGDLAAADPESPRLEAAIRRDAEIVCDEETIDRALRESGFGELDKSLAHGAHPPQIPDPIP